MPDITNPPEPSTLCRVRGARGQSGGLLRQSKRKMPRGKRYRWFTASPRALHRATRDAKQRVERAVRENRRDQRDDADPADPVPAGLRKPERNRVGEERKPDRQPG